MERFIRKLFGLAFSALLAGVLLVGCISNDLGDEKSMNIKIDGIEQITVSTQTTGQKQDVIIEKEKYEDVCKNDMDNHDECFYRCGRCRRRQVAYENYNENGAVFPVCCGGREEHGSSVCRRHRVHSGMGGTVAF